ncbi:MAG: hypothetical protein LBK42_09895 [Propionibacteriaceae bacterium]|nr:hypothetical protein [Propionibacteriaceae bacterium]
MPAAALAQWAYSHPESRVAVAGHPAAYPGLLDWLAALGDPAVAAAVAERRARQVATPPLPPPPAVPPQAAGPVSQPAAVTAPWPAVPAGSPGPAAGPVPGTAPIPGTAPAPGTAPIPGAASIPEAGPVPWGGGGPMVSPGPVSPAASAAGGGRATPALPVVVAVAGVFVGGVFFGLAQSLIDFILWDVIDAYGGVANIIYRILIILADLLGLAIALGGAWLVVRGRAAWRAAAPWFIGLIAASLLSDLPFISRIIYAGPTLAQTDDYYSYTLLTLGGWLTPAVLAALACAGWFKLRGRPNKAFVALPVVLATAFIGRLAMGEILASDLFYELAYSNWSAYFIRGLFIGFSLGLCNLIEIVPVAALGGVIVRPTPAPTAPTGPGGAMAPGPTGFVGPAGVAPGPAPQSPYQPSPTVTGPIPGPGPITQSPYQPPTYQPSAYQPSPPPGVGGPSGPG